MNALRPLLTLLLLTALALAGCTDDGEPQETPDKEQAIEETFPPLHGWVFDQALRPMEGVTVQLLDSNATLVTDGEGYYGFDQVKRNEPLVLVANVDGYEPNSRQVTVPADASVRLNFTMVPVPVKQASSEVLDFNGFIACQATVVASEDVQQYDCGGGQDQDVWTFSSGPDLAGAVIEIAWTAGNPAADSFHAIVETIGLGDFNAILAEGVGTSVLRLQIPQAVAEKYYTAGGQMRLTVSVEPNVDEEEAGTGAGAAINQEFQAFASLFYVEPPPTTYSIQNQ